MATAQDIVNIALAEVGYKKAADGSSKYGRWYKDPEFSKAPYCAMFVSWVFDRAKMPLHPIQHTKGFAYCPFGVNWFKNMNMFYKSPQRGDIVFFDWGGDRLADHVGIVETVHPQFIKTIEGNTAAANQSNGGKVMRRTRYYQSCLGFARPEYDQCANFSWNGFYLELKNPYMRGTAVKTLQKWLNKLGYKLIADGVYGEITAATVKVYQADNLLEVDGVVGAITWEELKNDVIGKNN